MALLHQPCRPTRTLSFLLIGCFIGVSTTWCMWLSSVPSSSLSSECPQAAHLNLPISGPAGTVEKSEQFILIGIMTAAKYVDTRAYNVWKTWAQDIKGKVLFFVAEDTVSIHPEMPLVRLKGVDDTYPPQKKSFAMVKWMADNMLHDFEWFVRADDDLYIKGEEMEAFLRRLDSARPYSIGQAGLGNTAEYGLLALGATDNYCMGGPGVVFSRETVRQVAPHLEECLSHLLTGHEDVELGRCIRRHVGISCTWNYEMQKLFHNNQSATSAYTGNLEETKGAITLHPIKEPTVMRRMHGYMKMKKLRELKSSIHGLQQKLSQTKEPSLVRTVPSSLSSLPYFSFIDNARIIFCGDGTTCPRHTVEQRTRNSMAHIVNQLFDEFNVNARQRGRVLQFQGLQYAYLRVSPRHGVDYILDMLLWFKKFRPPHRTTLSVRRHAYVQQTFDKIEAISEVNLHKKLMLNVSHPSSTINVILPLKGRASIFSRFVTHLRNVCMRAHGLNLVVVLYSSEEEPETRVTIEEVSKWMSVKVVEMGEEPFSRGVALTKGSAHLSSDSLLFFTDVDMLFTCDTLHRIRHNTIYRSQVFFPIVFSEFSPDSWSENDRLLADAFHYGRRRGYFRHFGYGLCSIYKGDLEWTGGFNTTITGWGMEDVDLFEKVIKHDKLKAMRAPEPGLVHIYHPIHCDPNMGAEQRKMCEGTKANSLASIDSLLQTLHHLT